MEPSQRKSSHSAFPIALKYLPSRYLLGSLPSPNKFSIFDNSKFKLLNPISNGLRSPFLLSLGIESLICLPKSINVSLVITPPHVHPFGMSADRFALLRSPCKKWHCISCGLNKLSSANIM